MVGGNYGGQYCLLLGTHTYTLHHNHYYSDREFVPAFELKLASTFVLALVEEKLTHWIPCSFLHKHPLWLWPSKAKLPRNASISILNNVCLAGSGIESASFQSLLSSLSLLSSKRFLGHCVPSNFLHRLSWSFSESILINDWRHC